MVALGSGMVQASGAMAPGEPHSRLGAEPCPARALGLSLREACATCDGRPRNGQAILARNDIVQREGEPATALHLVVSGLFREMRLTEDGRAIDMRLVRPGDVVGVEALDGGQYQCTLQALTRGRVCRMPVDQVIERCRVDPTQMNALNRVLARAIREMRDQVVRLGARSANERVRSLALELAGDAPAGAWIDLPFGREEMGALLGLDRATVSRALHRLVREGALVLDGRRFRLPG